MKAPVDVRNDLVDFLHRDLVGPAGGPIEEIADPPAIRYAAGVLFPQESLRNESEAVGGIEGDGNVSGSDEIVEVEDEREQEAKGTAKTSAEPDHDDTVTLANTYRPSAMGLSFLVNGSCCRLRVSARAGTYESSQNEVVVEDQTFIETRWKREELELPVVDITLPTSVGVTTSGQDLSPGLSLRWVLRRRAGGAALVTISLYNTTRSLGLSGMTFYQVGFEVQGSDGEQAFSEYRELEGAPIDEEETTLAMLYRERREYAVGHGCAADWEAPIGDSTARVRTSVLPAVVVPPVNPVSEKVDYLDMEFLAGRKASERSRIPEALEKLCGAYEEWIANISEKSGDLPERFQLAAQRNITLCRTALERISAGVAVLRNDEEALDAFCLMNQVMLMQQFHSKKKKRRLSDEWSPLPSELDEYTSSWEGRRGYWRSFQIAFVLMTLSGIGESDLEVEIDGIATNPHDLVDLIWFPTGGGKTEAYLGLTAYTIFRRRMTNPDDEGCKVLMRYTLRLLTSQQFQRGASLICACEIMRRRDPDRFGAKPITIGMWVGVSLTPNEEAEALRAVARLVRKPDEAKNPFQLLNCPWCGTELDNRERLGYAERVSPRRMIFQCPVSDRKDEPGCPFSKAGTHLPVVVVDESIYRNPPTLIIGTVDKFAMLAWNKNAGSILTKGGGPELIIQDELHLITGPLGSMVGLYEGVIEYLCSANGRTPKIIASTATIRRADQQCRALYDRRMFQFPPSGLDASDSFFAKEDPSAAGRMYVGFLPTASSSPLTAQIRSVVALQQGAVLAAGQPPEDHLVDPYWTLVQYFGSLKELGRAATFVTADIPEFLPTMHRRYGLEGEQRRWMNSSEELTSRKNEDEIPKILKRLETRYAKGEKYESQALDTVLATNMISVGVDVDRLGAMLVVTQPKGTAEYIQASSRVGRSDASPGLVTTLYNASRPRDRSHYEHFRGFHQAFYRHVEPSSVTPFSPPAMERALHAVLVIAGRHVAGWSSPEEVDEDAPEFCEFLDFLSDRAKSVDSEHEGEMRKMARRRMEEWAQRSPEQWGNLGRRTNDTILMRAAGSTPLDDIGEVWDTPTSMRNVDVECEAMVIPGYYHREVA